MTKSQQEIAQKATIQRSIDAYAKNFDVSRYNLTKPVYYNHGDWPPKENANESLKNTK